MASPSECPAVPQRHYRRSRGRRQHGNVADAVLQFCRRLAAVLEGGHAKKHDAMGRPAGVPGGGAAGPAAGRRAGRSGSTRRRSGGGSRALEAALGARLFDRSPRGLRADRGRARPARPRPGDGEPGAARRRRRSAARPTGCRARSGSARRTGCRTTCWSTPATRSRRDNPDLQVQVVALPRMFSLSKREADLAITVSPPTAGRLTVRKIADYRLRLYARADLVAGARAGPDHGGPARAARHRLHLGHDLRPASSTTTRCSGARPSRR